MNVRSLRWMLLPAMSLLLATMPVLARAASPDPGGESRVLADQQQPTPTFAYYYIWFTEKSWDRAKQDYPLLGNYSSDDAEVMRQHIRWAKEARIDGFIVSWKNTPVLTRRLEQLATLAAEEQFKLSIIYQGLDFDRQPVPAKNIAEDIDFFREHFASNPVFFVFERPLIIWSGTWRFSTADVASVTAGRRDDILILASERSAGDYERLAPYVDGDAYYWSSVNPETYPGYEAKLTEMANAVHGRSGIWIAPAAPGFDARLIGGSTIVERKDGATLLRQLDIARRSNPDMIGIISWNEFSENSHIEPSKNFRDRYLTVLADAAGARFQPVGDLDSSWPGASHSDARRLGLLGFFAFVAMTLAALTLAGWRLGGERRRMPPPVRRE